MSQMILIVFKLLLKCQNEYFLQMDVELAIMVTDVSTNADIQTLGKHAKNVVSVPSPYAVLSLDVTPLDVRKPFQLV